MQIKNLFIVIFFYKYVLLLLITEKFANIYKLCKRNINFYSIFTSPFYRNIFLKFREKKKHIKRRICMIRKLRNNIKRKKQFMKIKIFLIVFIENNVEIKGGKIDFIKNIIQKF